MAYSKELKEATQAKMLPPNNQSVSKLNQETGIPEGTLKKWRSQIKRKGLTVVTGSRPSEQWRTREKFHVVLETATHSEIELGEYCRKKGLYADQVKTWRDNCMQANGGVAQELACAVRQGKEKDKVVAQLRKELQRKDAALAETAALLVLRKKLQAIWGSPDDEDI